MAKVFVDAIAHGVFAGANGEIYHFDHKNENERYRQPEIDEADLARARERGLIAADDEGSAIRRDRRQKANDSLDQSDVSTIGKNAAQRTAEFAKVDAKATDGVSSLDTRQSIAWSNEDRARIQGGAEGIADGANDGESDEEIHGGDLDAPGAGGADGDGEGDTGELDADGLRLDGPTVEEFVQAGYKAVHYPPQGYASRSTDEEILAAETAQATGNAGRPATVTADGVSAEGTGTGSGQQQKPQTPATPPKTPRLGTPGNKSKVTPPKKPSGS